MIQITIPGKPIAKKRPKFVSRASKKAYNPQETEEGRWIWEARQQINQKPLAGPINLTIHFIMPITKAWSKYQRIELQRGVETFWHIKRPDLDNLVKFVKDCLNGLAWKDDSQVAYLEAHKIYGILPRTMLWITPL